MIYLLSLVSCGLDSFADLVGAIIWARQLERQLNTYLQRVEDVLGRGWELDVEGQKLKADGDNFRRKLNTDQAFFCNLVLQITFQSNRCLKSG